MSFDLLIDHYYYKQALYKHVVVREINLLQII